MSGDRLPTTARGRMKGRHGGVRSLKKLTCLSGSTHYVEPGTSSTVGPERQGNLVQTYSKLLSNLYQLMSGPS